ncbi:MAG: DUF2207 domain-containing protein [candidate division WOR-3 bacterium]
MIPRGASLLMLPALTLAGVSFPAITTVIDLSSDGSAHVVQEVTCRFEGKHRRVRLSFPAQYHDSRVLFNSLTGHETHDRVPGSEVDVRYEAGGLVVAWVPHGRDQARRYVIDLTVKRAVRRYDDVAHVRVPVVGRASGPIAQATVELRLPKGANRTFELADRSDFLVSQDRRNGSFSRYDLDRGDQLTADVLTDPDVFGNVRRTPGLMQEVETSIPVPDRDVLPEPDEAGPLRRYFGLGLLLLPLVLLLVLYLIYGREPRVSYDALYEREPPELIPPLAVPAIMRQAPDLTELPEQTLDATLATLVDAARRGALDLIPGDAHTGAGRGFVLAHPDRVSNLDELSRKVVDYYFTRVSGGRSFVTAEDVRRYATEKPDAFLFWLKQMSQEGRYWWWSRLGIGFLEPASSIAYQAFCLVAPLATAFVWLLVPFNFVFMSLDFSFRLRVVLMFVTFALSSAVYAYLGRVILRWSPPAYYEHLRWHSFRRFLIQFSAIEQAPLELSAIWQEYYVYAVALGIGERFMQGLSGLSSALSRADKAGSLLIRPEEAAGSSPTSLSPGLDAGAPLKPGVNRILEEFRANSGVPGKRIGRLQPLLFWQAGNR